MSPRTPFVVKIKNEPHDEKENKEIPVDETRGKMKALT